MSYRLHPVEGVILLETGEHITSRKHPGWQAYREFLQGGGEAIPPAVELEPIADVAERVRGQITEWRNAQEQGSIVFQHAGRNWDGGKKVRERMKPMLDLPSLPPGFFWTDADDNDVVVTMEELQALDAAHTVAMTVRGFEIHARQRQMKAELEGLTRQELQTYPIGWPQPTPPDTPAY